MDSNEQVLRIFTPTQAALALLVPHLDNPGSDTTIVEEGAPQSHTAAKRQSQALSPHPGHGTQAPELFLISVSIVPLATEQLESPRHIWFHKHCEKSK